MHKELSLKGHFHFIGVGGIGMSAIAIALIKKGYSVSGSDLIKNDEIERLKKLGAIIFDAQIKNNIDFVNAKFQNQKVNFVISSAIKDENEELSYCKKNNFLINKYTLDPRADSEVIIEVVTKNYGNSSNHFQILYPLPDLRKLPV